LEISFAHRTFAWGSDAKGKAHVHVVIIGLTKRAFEPLEKRLFSYDDINGDPAETKHKALSPYLFDAGNLRDRHTVVEEISRSLCGAPKMIIGSKPIDGGYLILNDIERESLIESEPAAASYIRPFIGGSEYIQGGGRWILALQNTSPQQLRAMPKVMEILRQVKAYRLGEIPPKRKPDGELKTPGISARSLAETPTRFHVTVIPKTPFLAVPENSSSDRDYIPIGWLEPPIIPSNKLRFVDNADLWHFGVLVSRIHVAWARSIGGRIKSDFQYSIGIVYNTFPWPEASETQKEKIRVLAQAVLDARAKFPGATLADLYDPDSMPPELRKAHRALDAAVDGLYKRGGFASDRERVEHLFALYEKLAQPLAARAGRTKGRKNSR
jgi:hypothetical protein